MDIKKTIQESIDTKQGILSDDMLLKQIEQAAEFCVDAFKKDKKLLFCGNGGSASDAQHIASELSGRFVFDREPLYAEALSVNSSYITAVANDYSFEKVFSRMVKAAGREGDVLVGLSTSGNSENVVQAIKQANELKMTTIGLTGRTGGKLADICDICIKVPSSNTARIQESHILIGHIICEIVENRLFPRN